MIMKYFILLQRLDSMYDLPRILHGVYTGIAVTMLNSS